MDLEALDRIQCQEDHVAELEERPGSELVKKDVLILDFGTDRDVTELPEEKRKP